MIIDSSDEVPRATLLKRFPESVLIGLCDGRGVPLIKSHCAASRRVARALRHQKHGTDPENHEDKAADEHRQQSVASTALFGTEAASRVVG
jgi:hypothetical protein